MLLSRTLYTPGCTIEIRFTDWARIILSFSRKNNSQGFWGYFQFEDIRANHDKIRLTISGLFSKSDHAFPKTATTLLFATTTRITCRLVLIFLRSGWALPLESYPVSHEGSWALRLLCSEGYSKKDPFLTLIYGSSIYKQNLLGMGHFDLRVNMIFIAMPSFLSKDAFIRAFILFQVFVRYSKKRCCDG